MCLAHPDHVRVIRDTGRRARLDRPRLDSLTSHPAPRHEDADEEAGRRWLRRGWAGLHCGAARLRQVGTPRLATSTPNVNPATPMTA